jgi:uncharacterized DUF497 family protein
MAFQWDERKRLRNIAKRGFDFLQAEELFDGPHVIVPSKHSQPEERQGRRQMGHGGPHHARRSVPHHLDEERAG